MILQICLIIIGAAFVILGADKLTEGAAALARKMKMSEMIIGLTIVAAGTSAPELFSSLGSALKDKPDMRVSIITKLPFAKGGQIVPVYHDFTRTNIIKPAN